MKDVGAIRTVDGEVENVYRAAGEDQADPPGLGPLVRAILDHRVHLVKWDASGTEWRERRPDEWFVHVPLHASLGEIGNALAGMLAFRTLQRRGRRPTSREVADLADALVFPTPAARVSTLSIPELAERLVTTEDLLERRYEAVGALSVTLRCVPPARPPLARGRIIDLSVYRVGRSARRGGGAGNDRC